jgi:tetratricopeptide (TPR) repeat protein
MEKVYPTRDYPDAFLMPGCLPYFDALAFGYQVYQTVISGTKFVVNRGGLFGMSVSVGLSGVIASLVLLPCDQGPVGSNIPWCADFLLGEKALRQRNVKEAEKYYLNSLKSAEIAGKADNHVNLILNRLGFTSAYQRKYGVARDFFLRSLELDERTNGPNSSQVAATLANVATVSEFEGRFAEAESYAARAVSIMERLPSTEGATLAIYLQNLGTAYFNQGKYAEAENVYQRALAKEEQVNGSDSIDLISILDSLGVAYFRQGKHTDAVCAYSRALVVLNSNPMVKGSRLFGILGRYADVLRKLNRDVDAQGIERLAATMRSQCGSDREAA